MNIKQIIQEEIDSFEWAKEDTIYFEVGTCMEYQDGRRYMVTSFSKTPSGTEILNTVTRMNNKGTWKSKGLSKSHVMDDLNNGTMTFCHD